MTNQIGLNTIERGDWSIEAINAIKRITLEWDKSDQIEGTMLIIWHDDLTGATGKCNITYMEYTIEGIDGTHKVKETFRRDTLIAFKAETLRYIIAKRIDELGKDAVHDSERRSFHGAQSIVGGAAS